MNNMNNTLEDQLRMYEEHVKGFKSYLKEINDRAAEYGTDKAHFEEDVLEAEHNIKYYEGEIGRVKKELGEPDKDCGIKTGAGAILPQTVKQGIGSLIFSSIGFVAGALIGSRLKSRRSNKGVTEDKRES
jgi:hypothetical protein